MAKRGQGRGRCCALIGAAVLLLGAPPAAGATASKHGAAKKKAHVVLGPKVSVVETTSDLSLALDRMPGLTFSSASAAGAPIKILDRRTYQHFRGAGGAMTDASAWLLKSGLPSRTRRWVLGQLFGPKGINLNLIRVPIGATDFTAATVPYSYDDVPPGQSDPTLSHFSIGHDQSYILPMLRQSLALAQRPFVIAAPWSPPAWMKSNDQLSNPGNSGKLLPSAYGPLSQYLVRFLQAYAGAGVKVQALTPQNEPGQGTTYPGLSESADQEATFIHGYLAPALRAARLRTPIYGDDLSWSAAGAFGATLLNSPARNDLAGLGSHCYYGSPTVMAALHRADPKLEQLETECSPGLLFFPVPEMEIASLREWATGIELWNLALNPRGGPVEPPNYGCQKCKGFVTINPLKHSVAFTQAYYYVGQLSKFVRPGAVRIASRNFVTYTYKFLGADIASPGLDDVAFRNPDGTEVLVTYNGAAKPIRFGVHEGKLAFDYRLPAGAMATFRWRPKTHA